MDNPNTGSVDRPALAVALKRVVPFRYMKGDRENISHVWLEADGGFLTLIASDGYRMARATLEADWPNGQWLLDGESCRVFTLGLQDGEAPVSINEQFLSVGNRDLPVVGTRWVDYARIVEAAESGAKVSLILDRQAVQGFLARVQGDVVGLLASGAECRAYAARTINNKTGAMETLSNTVLPTRMVTGEGQAAFQVTYLKEALGHCAENLTFSFGPTAAGILECPDYWHGVMLVGAFPPLTIIPGPREVKVLAWIDDFLKSVRKGKVTAAFRMAAGGLAISWDPQPPATTVAFDGPNSPGYSEGS